MKTTSELPEIAIEIFRNLPDPRVERTKVHSLEVIMFIALLSSLSGLESFYDMEAYAEARQEWLKATVGMQSVPSHDTFNRVFQAISPEYFGKCLIDLSQRLREKISGDVVAFDGKTHRGTGDATSPALHMLNAWSVGNRLVLGQLAVEKSSNEITAMPKLMDMLDLQGCVVTADAMNCQKAIAAKALEKKADYILALKGNHPVFHDEVKRYMDDIAARTSPGFESVESGHGRIEIRRCWQSEDIFWYAERNSWPGLKSFCVVESVRERNGQQEISRRYYISSLGYDARRVGTSIRAHWEIENSLHWCLDVVFNEDQSRARARHAAKNLGTLRVICLNLIKRMPGKRSMKAKRFQVSLSDEYLFKALGI
jgi:predicted transposase YbfD/YdcC